MEKTVIWMQTTDGIAYVIWYNIANVMTNVQQECFVIKNVTCHDKHDLI